MGRPRVHDDALATRLLDRAAHTVSSGGVRALSLRTLAKEARTSTAAVYSLFGGKPGLLAALYEKVFTRLGEAQAGVGVSDDPLEDLVQLGLAYRQVAISDPNGYRIMFGDEVRPADLDSDAADMGARTFDPLLDAVHRAVAAGRFPDSPPPASIATALWGNVHGLVSLELGQFLPPQAGDPAAVFESAVRATIAGWAARGGGSDVAGSPGAA
ncbi:TetR/AcrR family transcriptional regulator [Actinobacteria bacterium YIM 96077]|uniref:TetR/AcrR family transcriptional regulator n=1 Tax=Phytoactinopolyspora halophila TaxID=1981511 RepID=A0A329R0C0_9ACTN|nr:TetR/AcrR family transcriptional regulator [Phytoactinopolyspora halophila]AYY11762.1 TetR/AcrR family transcriptional regulator [Actinobacteria bacterium YIM 96077]RAW17803.1 TetR/AcrR family transcriptional regulator [Phytoactinopolyspora halophila]